MFQKISNGCIFCFLVHLFGGQLFELFACETNLKKQSSVNDSVGRGTTTCATVIQCHYIIHLFWQFGLGIKTNTQLRIIVPHHLPLLLIVLYLCNYSVYCSLLSFSSKKWTTIPKFQYWTLTCDCYNNRVSTQNK